MNKAILIQLLIRLVCLTAFAQDLQQKVTIKFEEAQLEEVLDYIGKTYCIDFSYGNVQVPLTQKVNYQVVEQHLDIVLKELFSGLHIEFKVIENHVVLRKVDESEHQFSPTVTTLISSTSIDVNDTLTSSSLRSKHSGGIQDATFPCFSRKGLMEHLGNQHEASLPFEKIKTIPSENGYTSKNVGGKVSILFGPNFSFNRYQFSFKTPENGDQTYTTDINYSIGLSVLFESVSPYSFQLIPVYTTRNFSYMYHYRIFDINDPTPIPKETCLDLAYLDIPVLVNLNMVKKKHSNCHAQLGDLLVSC
ncbi:MAG: PorT family protein [Cyclobacteriaceae bacterium]|nr:PorT family protein [Cyclobacteriaceae bacterium]